MQFTSSLRNGLIGAWCPSVSGWGGNLLRDLSGYGNHGTLTNMDPATDWVVSGGTQALDFDGVNDFVLCTQNYVPLAIPVTATAWVVLSVVGQSGTFVAKSDGNISNDGSWAIATTNGGSGFRALYRDGATTRSAASTSTYSANVPFFVAATYSQTDVSIFINGSFEASSTIVNAIASNSQAVTIGSREGLQAFLNGRLLEARVYNRILSAQEIRTLYTGGPGVGLRPERKRRYVQSGNRRRRLICGANC